MRKIVNGLMAFMLLIACAIAQCLNASAAEVDEQSHIIVNSIDDRYGYIDLEISNGVAKISSWVGSTVDVTRLEQRITLQRNDGGRWINVKTWSKVGYSTREFFSTTHSLSKRGKYRCQLKASVLAEVATVLSAGPRPGPCENEMKSISL